MLNNYFNPGAIEPKQGYTPTGFMGGMRYDQSMQDHQQAMFLQKLLTMAEAERQQMTNQEYKLDAPVRAAARPAAIAKSGLDTMMNQGRQGQVPALIAGEVGQAQQQTAAGRLAAETTPTRIDATNTENRLKQLRNQFEMVRAVGASNPLDGEAAYQDVMKTVPQQFRKMFPPHYTPEAIEGLMRVFTDTPGHRQDMEKEREQTNRALNSALINANSRVSASAAAYGARRKTLKQMLAEANNPGRRLAVAQMIENDMESTEADLEQARQVAYQAATELAATLGVRLPAPLPGLPGHSANDLINMLREMAPKPGTAPGTVPQGAPGSSPQNAIKLK